MDTQEPITARLPIDRYGDQAFHAAVKLIEAAAREGNEMAARLYGPVAMELLEMGYHLYPKRDQAT